MSRKVQEVENKLKAMDRSTEEQKTQERQLKLQYEVSPRIDRTPSESWRPEGWSGCRQC